MSLSLWIAVIVWTTAIGLVQSVDRPLNTAALVGQEVWLMCDFHGSLSASETHDWREYVTTSNQPTTFVLDGKVVDSHPWKGQVKVNGTYNVGLPGSANFAGKYNCRVFERPADFYAILVILESPTCGVDQASWSPGTPIAEGSPVALVCTIHYYGSLRPVMTWHASDDQLLEFTDNSTSPGSVRYVTTVKPEAKDDGQSFRCDTFFEAIPPGDFPEPEFSLEAPVFNESCRVPLSVHYGPRQMTVEAVNGSQDAYIAGDIFLCACVSQPEADDFRWERLAGSGPDTVQGAVLEVTPAMEGTNTYQCIASNFVVFETRSGFINVSFVVDIGGTVVPQVDEGVNIGAVVGGVVGGVVLVVLILVATFFILKRTQPATASKIQATCLGGGKKSRPRVQIEMADGSSYTDIISPRKVPSTMGLDLSTDTFEIPESRVKLIQKLGEGSFGQVWKGQLARMGDNLGDTVAAVKMLRDDASDIDKRDLLGELEVMKCMTSHPHVVRLIACCTVGKVMVIVEYMSNGNLQEYLRDHRDDCRRSMADDNFSSRLLNPRLLVQFAYQAALGMEHIATNQLLHRDLAARNVLLSDDLTCKISDFGLARDVVDRHVYMRESQGPLPVRWMAPESLFDNVYTTKSDVWSFGVLLWEIVAIGATPYPGLNGRQVLKMIQRGERMEKPEHCTENLYLIMRQCWEESPKQRPSFSSLAETLHSLMEHHSQDYIALEHYSEAIYVNLPHNLSNEKC